MRDAITSFNHWIREKLPDELISFEGGKPAVFPCAVILARTIEPRKKNPPGAAALATIMFQADCWADGGDALSARTFAEKIMRAVLGESDGRTAIPRYAWDYSQEVPEKGAIRDFMIADCALATQIETSGTPELKLWRLLVAVRAALSF